MLGFLYFHCFIPFESPRAAHEWGCAAPWPPKTPRRCQGSCQRSQGQNMPSATGPHVSSGPHAEMQAHACYTRPRPAPRGFPTPAPPARGQVVAAGSGEARGEVTARRPRRGRGKGGKRGTGLDDPPRDAAAQSPRAGADAHGRRRSPGQPEGSGAREGSGGGHFLTAASSVTTATAHSLARARHVAGARARGGTAALRLGPRKAGRVWGGGGWGPAVPQIPPPRAPA